MHLGCAVVTHNPVRRNYIANYGYLACATSCSSDSSFSTLCCLKTYLRSTIWALHDRLNGLTLLNIYRDIQVTPEQVIVTTFDICRFQGVTALALTTLWKPWVFAINICGFSFV
jgi:hypothetical protein